MYSTEERILMNLSDGLVITRDYDGDSENPREWANLTTFLTWEHHYNSPDYNAFSDSEAFIDHLLGCGTFERLHDKYATITGFFDEITSIADKKGFILLPVSKFEHGTVNYYIGTDSGWDCGTVGVIYVSKADIYNEYNVKRISKKLYGNVIKQLENELEVYTQWGNGEVYTYTLESVNGDFIDGIGGMYTYNVATTIKELSEYFDLGNSSDWEPYDQKKIDDTFIIETVTTVTRKDENR